VDQGQAESELGPAAVGEGQPFPPAPAKAGGGIGDVADEWEDRLRALAPERPEERLHDRDVGVHRHGVVGLGRGGARVAAVVAAEIPHEPPPPRSGCLADESLLGGGVRLVVRVGLPVAAPGGLTGLPLEAGDELDELARVGADELRVEPGSCELALGVTVGVAAFQPRVEDNVRKNPASEAVAEAEQAPHLRRLDSLERASEPRLEGDSLVRLEEERVEDQRAELPVAGPGLSLAEPVEGPNVHEGRPGSPPLDVVRRPVLEDEALVERPEEELELQERRLLQHPERPLVRVGDDRYPLVSEHAGHRAVCELFGKALRLGDPLGCDELPLGDLVAEECGRGESLPVGQPALGERAQHAAVGVEDAAVRVAEGAWLDPGFRACYRSSFRRMRRKPRSRRQ
jgi:hypothetical protein